MAEESQNALLKTLEEPPPFAAPDPGQRRARGAARDGALALPAGALRAARAGGGRGATRPTGRPRRRAHAPPRGSPAATPARAAFLLDEEGARCGPRSRACARAARSRRARRRALGRAARRPPTRPASARPPRSARAPTRPRTTPPSARARRRAGARARPRSSASGPRAARPHRDRSTSGWPARRLDARPRRRRRGRAGAGAERRPRAELAEPRRGPRPAPRPARGRARDGHPPPASGQRLRAAGARGARVPPGVPASPAERQRCRSLGGDMG